MAGGRDVLNDYPVQPAKVQRPPLRDETLARDRLLDWLAAKIHHRVVFVIAEAGYGKTTLLADFSRRTRVRTLWYRLDEEDRNWIAFVSYLIAAGREHDEGFAPITAGMLREIGPSGPTRQAVVETLLRELRSLGEHGAVLILDDFHLVDDAPEVREIAGELIARAPERVSFVVLSRRLPSVKVARLRALGEVAELGTDDLRFNGDETERLFRETYRQPLDGDVLEDLSQRTEGWAASLQLVQAAIRDRSPTETRRFIRSLSGAEGDLYDYLAEEVVGDLPEQLQDFLMKASILQSLGSTGLQDVSGLDEKATTSLLSHAEKVGLVGRPHRGSTERRFHPLVRQFLTDRLRRDIGADGVRSLHLQVAEAAKTEGWQTAAHHFLMAGDLDRLQALLEGTLPAIVSGGLFVEAAEYVELLAADRDVSALRIVTSRVAQQHGDFATASIHALTAVAKSPPDLDALALANLLNLRVSEGDPPRVREVATRILERTVEDDITEIARATLAILGASVGSIVPLRNRLEEMARRQSAAGHRHYLGISMLNLAYAHRLQANITATRQSANVAIEALEGSSAGVEVSGAYCCRAWSYAHEGDWPRALADINYAIARETSVWRAESMADVMDIIAMYDDPTEAVKLGDLAATKLLPFHVYAWTLMARARVLAQVGRLAEAESLLADHPRGETTTPGSASILSATTAYLALLGGSADSARLARQAVDIADAQEAHFWSKFSSVLVGAIEADRGARGRLSQVAATEPAYLSVVAEAVAPRLHAFGDELGAVAAEVERRPGRWRPALRNEVANDRGEGRLIAARLLDQVGEMGDVAALRAVARANRKVSGAAGLGRGLARLRAQKVFVDDLGRVAIQCGERLTAGGTIRRRVLGLLCLILSQQNMSTTREFVMDALWPDLDPTAALNSLNQTIYFLRRVIEPKYDDDTSPGYVHHDGELIWLDAELVDSRSNQCRSLIRKLSTTASVEEVDALTLLYTGRFALDFEYEEWAAPYREWLHAAFLEIVERSIREDLRASQFDRAIRIARTALEVDSRAEHLELLLLRAYRMSGAHAAAAEQYEHYASVLRSELGVEPPPLDAL